MNDLHDIADHLLELVGSGAEAQVMVSDHRLGLTRFANSSIHQHVGEEARTISLKVASDGRVVTVGATYTDKDGVEKLVEQAFDVITLRPEDPDWPGVTPPTEVPDVHHDDPYTHEADPADRAGYVKGFVDADPDLRAAGFCDSEGTTAVFANSAGHRADGRFSRATMDGIHQTETSAGKAHETALRLNDLDGSAIGRTAARLARDSAGAEDLEPGRYEVVLSPECVATIVVFLAFYGFNAKPYLEGQSFARLGETQFDPAFRLWDDALDPRALGLPFDVEGTPKTRLDLVEGGVTKALAHDRRTAKRADAESTGHAIQNGDSYGALPTNLFVGTGDATFEDLVNSVERGLVVTEFNYCRVLDPKTQVVTGLTRNGTFLVENGEIVRPVTNLRFTQSFVEGLAPGRVRGIAEDARFADAEFGPGMACVPAMHLESWNFTGGAQG